MESSVSSETEPFSSRRRHAASRDEAEDSMVSFEFLSCSLAELIFSFPSSVQELIREVLFSAAALTDSPADEISEAVPESMPDAERRESADPSSLCEALSITEAFSASFSMRSYRSPRLLLNPAVPLFREKSPSDTEALSCEIPEEI